MDLSPWTLGDSTWFSLVTCVFLYLTRRSKRGMQYINKLLLSFTVHLLSQYSCDGLHRGMEATTPGIYEWWCSCSTEVLVVLCSQDRCKCCWWLWLEKDNRQTFALGAFSSVTLLNKLSRDKSIELCVSMIRFRCSNAALCGMDNPIPFKSVVVHEELTPNR